MPYNPIRVRVTKGGGKKRKKLGEECERSRAGRSGGAPYSQTLIPPSDWVSDLAFIQGYMERNQMSQPGLVPSSSTSPIDLARAYAEL